MSRSYRHTPILGITTARSEKQDKRKANRDLRRGVKVLLIQEDYDEASYLGLDDVSNLYSFAKDGKNYYDKQCIERIKSFFPIWKVFGK